MKTYLTYGFSLSFATALLIFALYFLGFHESAAKLGAANAIQTVGSLVIAVTCIVLGTQARRSEVPPAEDFGYGRAFGTGFMIVLFAALFGLIFNYLYAAVINPGFIEVVLESQAAQLEAAGLPADKIEQATAMMRKVLHPAVQSVIGFLSGLFFGTLLSLVTAAFLKRRATDEVVAA